MALRLRARHARDATTTATTTRFLKRGIARSARGQTLMMEVQESSPESPSANKSVIWDKESPANQGFNAFGFKDGDYALFHWDQGKLKLCKVWDDETSPELLEVLPSLRVQVEKKKNAHFMGRVMRAMLRRDNV